MELKTNMQTIGELKKWLSEFPEEATVSFATSAADGDEYVLLSIYPAEDCVNSKAKHVYIDLGSTC